VPVWPPLDHQLLADAAATYNWRLGLPTPLAITRDGAVLFRRTPPRSFASDLHELGVDARAAHAGSRRPSSWARVTKQLSDAEKARRERTRTATRGVVDIDVSDDGRTVLVPLGDRLTSSIAAPAAAPAAAPQPLGPSHRDRSGWAGLRSAFSRRTVRGSPSCATAICGWPRSTVQ